MKLKNAFILLTMIGFLSISVKGFSQYNYKHWFTTDNVSFFYELVPKKGSTHAFYRIKTVNGSSETKSIYYNPVFQNAKKQTSVDFPKRNFSLKSGHVDVKTYIITPQAIIQSGGKNPTFNFKEYRIKKY
jgi:hypothetical protein